MSVHVPVRVAAFSHVGFAVDSVDEFMSSWGLLLANDGMTAHDESSPGGVTVNGIDHGGLDVTVAFTRIGGLPIELIQTRRGRTCHQDWLEERGPGLHHLAFWVHDLPAQVSRAVSAGCELVMAPAGLSRAVLSVGAAATDSVAESVEASRESGQIEVPDFFAFLSLPTARTAWTLELLDIDNVDEYRALNGDLPGYPAPGDMETS